MLSRCHNLQQKTYRFQDATRCFQIDSPLSSLSRAIVIANLRAWGRPIYRSRWKWYRGRTR